MKVVALAGGVGGAKLASGLAAVLPSEDLTVIVNTGDDFEHLGLRICPDLDTVTYTLAGLANPDTGWGREGETWHFLQTLASLGGPTWFRVGDKDLAVHVERTRRLRQGEPLSAVTRSIGQSLGVQVSLLPMTDEKVSTIVQTDDGELSFQEYFVGRGFRPRVRGFRFAGVDSSIPAPGVKEAIVRADVIVLCPSNPWVSLDPILSVPGIREAIAGRRVVGVSPIIGGRAVKGPAAKMFTELGIEPSSEAVARHYQGLLTALVIDRIDSDQVSSIQSLGIEPVVTGTFMDNAADRARLAAEVLQVATSGLPARLPE
jgi:LPPG:FO 2-phospho-L-lactate transferase